ncbi:cupin domain-containing protein, partial [Streptomyces sp. NPDC050698]
MTTTSPQRYVPTTDETRTRDTLSHVLEVVHLRGDQIHRCVHSENFTVEVPAGVRALHIAERGDIVIRTHGKEPIELGPGEL